ncbi:MAG: lytic murein transglycosylase [Elusimicrobiales bacterium]|nr:lytic murein transglycosylase [Elusimicrobiales bacterium]
MKIISRTFLPLILLAFAASAASAEELTAGDLFPPFDISQVSADKAQAVPADVYQAVLAALKGSDVPESYAKAAFADPRVKIHEEIVTAMNKPAESLTYEQYRKLLLTEKRIAGGAQFYTANKDILASVNQKYGVDAFLLAGLVGVESNYGENRGKYIVFNALNTIAERIPRRSAWASKEIAELLKLSYARKKDPFALLGSYAGAFGLGQFMPSSYNAYAADFDGDAYPDLFIWPDALASISNYLVKHDYFSSPGFAENSGPWKALYGYNHSANYVNVILELRLEIQKRVTAPK